MQLPDLAAVIGNHAGERLLPACIASLRAQTLQPREIIVVDGASTDRSVEVATALGARVLVRPNRGLGHLYNEGARAATAPFVFLSNNDVALDDRCLELLAAELARNETLFAADPRQVDWSGDRLVHARAELRRGALLRRAIPGFDLDLTAPAGGVVPTVSANGGAMLVRREMMLRLDGFDETFFMDFEDLDLCWRAWLQGWGSVYVPEAWLRHKVGAVTHAGVMRRRLSSSHHNLLRFALKCLPAREAATVVAGELLRLPRHPLLIVPALLAIARELPEIVAERRRARPTRQLLQWMLAGQP